MSFFFFNDTATTEIYTLSLHDALPISPGSDVFVDNISRGATSADGSIRVPGLKAGKRVVRSEEHTSELQSQSNLVCRLLLEKKNCGDQTMRCPGSPCRPSDEPSSVAAT